MPPTQPTRINQKHHARIERERLMRRYLLLGAGIVILIVVGLIAYGYIQTAIMPPRQAVAKVYGEEISSQAFQDRTRFERNRLVQQYLNYYQTWLSMKQNEQLSQYFKQNLSQIKAQLDRLTMGERVLEQMIQEVIIRQEATKRGITVSEAELDKRIQEDFGYSSGEPTKEPSPFPTNAPTSTRSAEQMTLVPDWTDTPAPTTTSIASPTPTVGVTATSTLIPSPTLVPSVTPTATPYTLDMYKEQYKETVDRLKEEINFSEKDLREIIRVDVLRQKLYDEITKDTPIMQEQVWARHILVADEATAKTVLEEMKTNKDWKALVAKFSTDTGSKDNGGDLGWFSRGMMVTEFENAAFSLGIGEISQPIKTQYGYHIIQVLGHETRQVSAYEYNQIRQKVFSDWIANLRKSDQVQVFDLWKERAISTPDIPEAYSNLDQ